MEYFQNTAAFRSGHQDAFFNIAVFHLWRISLKNTFDGVRFPTLTLSNFEALVGKLKYFITALINEQLLL